MSLSIKKPPVLFLMGPTASGKTELAMELCDWEARFELISVDSAMVYKGLDIGSAKPDENTLKKYPHHLIDVVSAHEHYSAARFVSDTETLIKDIHQRQKVPLLVGGTMMYFNALLKGISELPERNVALRKELEQALEQEGHQALHQRLALYCEKSAKRIHPNDTQRLIRALEVCLISKRPMADLLETQKGSLEEYELIQLSLEPTRRELLHERIEKRFLAMIEQGFVEEVTTLLESGLTLEHCAMKSVGYRQMTEYLLHKCNKAQMIDKAIAATRGLAKRQLTWLRSWQDLKRFACSDENLLQSVKEYIQKVGL